MTTTSTRTMIPAELQPDVLVRAYGLGAFPMAGTSGNIDWYSPDPRAILDLQQFNIPRSLRQRIRKGGFEVRVDTCFELVIRGCADRTGGTWISAEMIEAYTQLHRLGLAHSVETFYDDTLAGGLYGVHLAGVFFGESMFSRQPDASKIALVALARIIERQKITLLDIQMITPLLKQFGAIEISRDQYLQRLANAMQMDRTFVTPTMDMDKLDLLP